MKVLVKSFWKPLIWLLLICYLTLTPSESLPQMPKLFEYDKIGHLILFLIFSLLLVKGFSQTMPPKLSLTKIKWGVFFIIGLLGGTIEILQANLIKNRNGDVLDLAADMVGSLLGLVLYNFFARKFYKLL
jgi:VanZ family protein